MYWTKCLISHQLVKTETLNLPWIFPLACFWFFVLQLCCLPCPYRPTPDDQSHYFDSRCTSLHPVTLTLPTETQCKLPLQYGSKIQHKSEIYVQRSGCFSMQSEMFCRPRGRRGRLDMLAESDITSIQHVVLCRCTACPCAAQNCRWKSQSLRRRHRLF